MDISALTNISSDYVQSVTESENITRSTDDFQTVLDAAMNMVSETNDYQNNAESAVIQFALGEATNTHDLQIAQWKANSALQYTVAVRDKVLEAYKEIMNMQI